MSEHNQNPKEEQQDSAAPTDMQGYDYEGAVETPSDSDNVQGYGYEGATEEPAEPANPQGYGHDGADDEPVEPANPQGYGHEGADGNAPVDDNPQGYGHAGAAPSDAPAFSAPGAPTHAPSPMPSPAPSPNYQPQPAPQPNPQGYADYGQPGYGTQPGYGQPGYGAQPGYAQQPNYGPQPGYGAQPGYGQYGAMSAYGGAQTPMPGAKSKVAAGLLGIFLGAFGIHNFYLGHTGKGVTQLLLTLLTFFILSPITMLWGLIEGILILASNPNSTWGRDANGDLLN